MAKRQERKQEEKPVVIPAETKGKTLIINIGDPVGMYITRTTGKSLPAELTTEDKGIGPIVKSYIVRSNGCNQITNAEAGTEFIKKNNLLNKESN